MDSLERGRIAFVMRPRVEGQPGVQSFAMVLSVDDEDMHRRITIGKNRLPRPGAKEREWAFVARVSESSREVFGDMAAYTYHTKTKGLRHQPAARVVGRGGYAIVPHEDHVHLNYDLDDKEPDDERESLEVRAEGSLIVAVFNPLAKWSARAIHRYGGNPDDPAPFAEPSLFPDELQARFGEKRFAPLSPDFLEFEGAELVLIEASRHLKNIEGSAD